MRGFHSETAQIKLKELFKLGCECTLFEPQGRRDLQMSNPMG